MKTLLSTPEVLQNVGKKCYMLPGLIGIKLFVRQTALVEIFKNDNNSSKMFDIY
jgi:hypothetical protein